MKILELYCGTKSVSKAFAKLGWETYTVDWNPDFEPTRIMDISKITYNDIIEICNGKPDVIWASPDCTSYSVGAIGHHRARIGNVLYPKTDYAKFCDDANRNLAKVLREYDGLVFIENPRAAMRKMCFWDYPMYTVTYCQYGDFRMKPTDIWTNHPNPQFKPPCKQGMSCHIAAPRGSQTGSQGMATVDSARIPEQLADHVAKICEEYYENA